MLSYFVLNRKAQVQPVFLFFQLYSGPLRELISERTRGATHPFVAKNCNSFHLSQFRYNAKACRECLREAFALTEALQKNLTWSPSTGGGKCFLRKIFVGALNSRPSGSNRLLQWEDQLGTLIPNLSHLSAHPNHSKSSVELHMVLAISSALAGSKSGSRNAARENEPELYNELDQLWTVKCN